MNWLEDKAKGDGQYAIAAAIIEASQRIASALDRLGLNGASSPLGAIEAHMMAVEKVAQAIENVAEVMDK